MHTHTYMCMYVCMHILYMFYTLYILQNKEEKANERGKNLFFTQREKEFDSKTLARKWKTWLECFIASSLSLKVTSPLGGFPGGSGGKESVYSVRDPGSVPGSGRSPGEGNGYPLHYSCQDSTMTRGTWWVTAHGVASVGHEWVGTQACIRW